MAADSRPHVVVIGGGFGGLDAARSLARAPVRVTVIDRHNYHLFQPLLYQVATAALSPGDIASPIRWILRRQRNVRVLLAEARHIDPVARCVFLGPSPVDALERLDQRGAVSQVRYDYLVLASGAAHAYFGHPEWADRAPGLKTLDDALEIRRRVLLAFEAAERERDPDEQRRLLTFVIIGGGPTGVELAGALAEIARQTLTQDFRAIKPESARVVLIEGGGHLLASFPDGLREAARRSLTRLGVEVLTGTMVTAVDERGVACRSTAAMGPGTESRLEAQTVLWAAGVAASPLAASLGVPLDRVGRVLVEPTLQVPGRPEIFVVGDVCALEQGGHWLPGVAQVAKQSGAHAARNIIRTLRGERPLPFHYRDFGNMATVGRGAAVADVFGVHASGVGAWLIWLFIHIFWLIGFRNRLAVLSEWAWAYVTLQRRVRLITGTSTSARGD
ncbi:MAG: NAD(P)/FAD-dependent oxidoreductase [Vicinamibacterales bacterium]